MSSSPKNLPSLPSSLDAALRPSRWDEYVGQKQVKANVRVSIDAAKKRGSMPEHILFYGPPGVGKTTLARSLASRPQVSIEPARLQGLVTASAGVQGLTIERLDSDSDGALQVSVQPAPFAQLLRWFAALEAQGVQIAEAGLDRAEDSKVAARLSLRVAP